jgi:transposase InsO family protein
MGAAFCACVAGLGMAQSANMRGPGDNAHAESFFHSLKAELTRGVTFASEHTLRTELPRYMRYDNTIRLHSGLAYLSPLAFERQVA